MSIIIAREHTERVLLADLVRSARETRLHFYLFSRLVSFSHRQLSQFENKQRKCVLLCLFLFNLTEMRDIKNHEYDFPEKMEENLNFNTRHGARQLQKRVNETDVNTVKETNSMHAK